MSKSALARKLGFAVLAVLLQGASAATAAAANSAATGPLRVLASNPRYFTNDDVHAVYLTGSHTWNNLQDWGINGSPQTFDFDAYVDSLVGYGHNFTLLWRTELPFFCNLPTTGSSPPNFTVAQHPWQRTGPGDANDGGLKFDLMSFDQSFFDRMRARVIQLGDAGIYVGVYLFTGEWLNAFRCLGDGYPLTGANNINSIDDGGGLGSVNMSSLNSITDIQDALIEKYVETLNDLDNVLWITQEELPSGISFWPAHLISHVRNYEAGKLQQHAIGAATYVDGSDSFIRNSNADWVAPGTKVSPTAPISGSGAPAQKITINDSDHPYFGMWNETPQQNRNVLWQNFTNGVGGYVFMDPWTIYYPRENRNNCASPNNGICSGVDTRWNNFRDNMGATLRYSQRIDTARATPQPGLCSTGFCLANGDAEFLVYQPNNGPFTVSVAEATYQFEWFIPATNTVASSGTVTTAAGSNTFTPPFSGDAVLLLQALTAAATVAIDTGPANPTTDRDATFTFHATGTVSGFRCQLDNAGGFSSCTSGKTYHQLSDGGHTFEVIGTTANGDVGPVTFSWTVDATAPVNVLVTAPESGQPVSGTFLLKATAQDGSGTIARMEFYIGADSIPTCADTSAKPTGSTFQCSWNSAAKPDGPHSVKAKAFDAVGNARLSSAVNFSIDNSGPAPTVAIDTGPANPTNRTDAAFTFHATGAVTGFACKLDNGNFSGCSSGKAYHNLTDGSHIFQVKATAAGGDVGPVSFSWTVDSTAPVNVVVSAPGSGQTISGPFLLKASALDGSGTIAKMEFYIDSDSAPACSDTSAKPSGSTFQCGWNSAAKPDGSHSVRAKAFDLLSNAALSAAVNFNIGNSAPTGLSAVELVTPASGQKVSGSFALKGSAHDGSGTIQKMEFYIDFDNVPACIDNVPKNSGAVFQCGWNTTTKGNGAHMITVKAHNPSGESAFSNAVSAIVDNPVISMVSPNGGETLRIGTNQMIQWNSGGIAGNVKVDIFQNGAWKTIIKKTPNDGTQKWKVKKPATTNAQIRVCTLAPPVVCGGSAEVFSIADKSVRK